MKVLNLLCSRQHAFEGWFGSEADFQSQLTNGLLECPLCADSAIQKMPSAPRLNLGSHPSHDTGSGARSPPQSSDLVGNPSQRAPVLQDKAAGDALHGPSPGVQAAFLKALRAVVSSTEDVGTRFADEARRMHYGEVDARSIRGQADVREVVELLEEGIEVMPLPMLPALKETLQ